MRYSDPVGDPEQVFASFSSAVGNLFYKKFLNILTGFNL
jgi:hypothetical protein